jgi:hypothetical protein
MNNFVIDLIFLFTAIPDWVKYILETSPPNPRLRKRRMEENILIFWVNFCERGIENQHIWKKLAIFE